MWRAIIAAAFASAVVVQMASCSILRPPLPALLPPVAPAPVAGAGSVAPPQPKPLPAPPISSPVADRVAADAVWIGRLGALVAVLGLAAAAGFRSKSLLCVSLAGGAALFASLALATVVPWLPVVAAFLAIGGTLAGLVWLALHFRKVAVGAARLPAAPESALSSWQALRDHVLSSVRQEQPGPDATPGPRG